VPSPTRHRSDRPAFGRYRSTSPVANPRDFHYESSPHAHAVPDPPTGPSRPLVRSRSATRRTKKNREEKSMTIGFRIHPMTDRVDPALVELFRAIPVANISDSMSRMTAGGPRLRPMHKGGVLAGPASPCGPGPATT
jgi:hypothetical protein